MKVVDEFCSVLGVSSVPENGVLGWEDLRRLARKGVVIGSHTRTHPIMTQLDPDQLRDEIVGAQQDLKREIGVALPIFCYPNGNYRESTSRILKEEGFVLAFTTRPGSNDLEPHNLLRVRRTNVSLPATPLLFRLRMRFA